jgi:hypothetical protein
VKQRKKKVVDLDESRRQRRFDDEAECVEVFSINRGTKNGMNGPDFLLHMWGHPTCHTPPWLPNKYLFQNMTANNKL